MADEGLVIECQSVEEWDDNFATAETDNKTIVADFSASWCGPCRTMAPVFTALAKKYPQLMFVKVDIDQLPDLSAKFEVQSVPTFLFIKEESVVHKIVGANSAELEEQAEYFSTATDDVLESDE